MFLMIVFYVIFHIFPISCKTIVDKPYTTGWEVVNHYRNYYQPLVRLLPVAGREATDGW